MLGGGGHGFLHGNIHMLSLPGGQTVVQGDEDTDERTVGGGVKGLEAPEFIGRGMGPTGYVHITAHGKANQIAGPVAAVGSGLAKGGQ